MLFLAHCYYLRKKRFWRNVFSHISPTLSPFSLVTVAREKVGQALRDMLHSKYRSSTKAKKLSRKVKQSMLDDEVDQIMNRGTNTDITERVKELTKNARRDSDFQKAFNTANLELLQTFKTEPLPRDGDDDDDEEEGAPTDDDAEKNAGSSL